MRLPFRPAVALLAILALSGSACHVSTSPESDLDTARSRWTRSHPSSYDIVVRRVCFCATEVTNPVLVSVREGVVTSRTYVGSGAQVSAQFASLFPTVEGIFRIVDDALGRNAYTLDVAYDPAYGFPVTIDIDYVNNAVDDELTVQMSGFVAR